MHNAVVGKDNAVGDYLAYYKKRTLIIRLAFEQYLLQNPKVKEELANGRSRKRED